MLKIVSFSFSQTESDVFFQNENIDSLFGEWSNLLGPKTNDIPTSPTSIDSDKGGVFPSPHPELPSNYDGSNVDENQMYPQKYLCSIM